MHTAENKIKLTLEDIKNAEPNSVILSSETIDSPNGLHINRTNKVLKFVITRGFVEDWTCYVESCWEDMDYAQVYSTGDKVFPETLKNILVADEEVWERFRS